MKTQIIEIRTGSIGLKKKISVIQEDTARQLRCILSDFIIPDESTARIYAAKPSGNKIYNDGVIEGNTVLVDITTQLIAEIGEVACQVEITESNGNVLTSFEFAIEVKKRLKDASAIESTNEFTALEAAIGKVQNIDAKVSKNTNDISELKTADNVLSSRVDTLASLKEGSTTGDAELLDIRVKADGTAATSAGNSVREQFNELKGDLFNLKPISSIDTTFVNSICNHVKGLQSENQGYWGTYGDEPTLSEMSFIDTPNSGIYAIKPIELKKGVTYKTTNARVYLSYVYDKVTKIYTRYYQVTTWKTKVFTMEITPENDSILYMSVTETDNENTMVVNGDVPNIYHAYGEPIGDSVTIPNLNKDNIIKHNVITVKKDGSGDFTTVYNAVNSITDANKYNIYDIHIHEGTYDVIEEVFGSGDYFKTEGIVLPPYVNLIGIGQRDKIILKAEFPNTVATEVSTAFSTINVDGSNNLENITFIAYNCRYACHDDDGNAEKSRNFVRNVRNCRFWHKGCYTDDGSVWKWCKAYAQGVSSGSVSNFEYCEFRTDVNIEGNCAWSSHGQEGVEKPSYITHKHCKFINTNFDLCASTNGLNDHVEEYVKYIGCEFTRSVGTGNNVEINKELYSSDGVYFNAYGIGNKNCYAGVGIYASGMSGKLHFFANDN